MLERMFMRWAEKQGFSVKVLERHAGDEAGLKSCELEILGRFAYGYLKVSDCLCGKRSIQCRCGGANAVKAPFELASCRCCC